MRVIFPVAWINVETENSKCAVYVNLTTSMVFFLWTKHYFEMSYRFSDEWSHPKSYFKIQSVGFLL